MAKKVKLEILELLVTLEKSEWMDLLVNPEFRARKDRQVTKVHKG